MDDLRNKNGNEGGNANNGATEKRFDDDDNQPKQFLRVGMSKDGKWFLVDTVTRHFIHVNYLSAIRRNKDAALAQERAAAAPLPVEQPAAQTPPGKSKRARKENDRTT